MPSFAATSPIAGRFVLESRAGSGGMGTVYRARDTLSGCTVAVKLLQTGGHAQDAERFSREAELLAQLVHPGIVTYLAHGETDSGQAYLAMEWLEGEDLSKRLCLGPLHVSEVLVLLRRIAEALAVAHARGVVHRDLKPSNLFLRDGQVERVTLLDFGIARRAEVSDVLTQTGIIIGTPSYMAPEQARGERQLTPAADVFSLGCVLFECLTGRPPFVADHALAVLARILFDEPPSLRRLRPELSETIEALLGRMLAKQPERRPPDAAALLAMLDTSNGVRLSALPSYPSSGGEQQLLSVLMAVPPAGVCASPGSPDSTITDEQLIELHRELADRGARLEVLPGGSLVAIVKHAPGVATDQVVRAAQCALLIKAHWPEAMVALSTGSGLADEQTPTGEVFDRAAALLRDHAEAPPSKQILLDEVTRGLLEVRFVLQQTPSGAHALTGEELALDASRPLLGRPTPCVGRDFELSILESALAGCIDDAEPRAMLMTAPPGAGKSRLRHELLRRLHARGDNLLILVGRGDPMTAGSSFSLLGQALRRLCGIVEGESLQVRRNKLAHRICRHIPSEERQRVTSFIGELCGIPFSDDGNMKLRAARQEPQLMNDQITQATLDLLRAECAERPVLVVLEDLHWGDALTVKLVEAALRKLKACALMVLALARPEVHELFPRLWPTAAQVVMLRPLSKKAGERLVQHVLGTQVSKEEIEQIVEQSEGNALLLEELIRAVAGGQAAGASKTVLAMLQARIGRLQSDARRVLRAASVFGETCWQGGIRALLEASVSEPEIERCIEVLLKEEILEERPETRFPGEQEYRFRHALMRDAAYDLFTEEDRIASHRVAGEYLEARGEPDALVLAEHFSQGREPARAIQYYVHAAEQAYDAYDMDAAMVSVKRGLACGAEGEQRGALLSVQSGVSQWRELYAEIIEPGIEAIELLREGSKRWCRACQGLFVAVLMTQPGPLLDRLAARFVRAEPHDDARGDYGKAAAWLCISFGTIGRKDAARTFLKRTREVCAEGASDMSSLGYLKGAEANDNLVIEEAPWSLMLRNLESIQACQNAGDTRTERIPSAFYGMALLELGDRDEAERYLRENLAIAERLNEALPLVYARVFLARLLATFAPLDHLDEPAELAREVIAVKNVLLTGVAYGVLALIKLRLGNLAGAAEDARTACEAGRPVLTYGWDIIGLRSHILLEHGRADEALAVAEEGVQELERLDLGGRGEIALRLALAEALHAVGRIDAAHAALAKTVERLRPRLDDIPDIAWRERYLTQVPTNARVLALAKDWLNIEVHA